MKIYTSYFYQIRNFKPNMIPISTAKWSPDWFNKPHIDKNNIVNGLKIGIFAPGDDCDDLCSKDCIYRRYNEQSTCPFLEKYHNQLSNIPIEDTMKHIESAVNYARLKNHFEGEPIVVLMVYETPDNPCSERKNIQEYFIRNGIECKELEYPIGKDDVK